MTAPAFATLATFRTDLAREAEQRAGLEHMIVPSVRQHPGFVAGTWTLDREAAESVVMLTYESRDAAVSMRESVTSNARHQLAVGLELVSVRVLEIVATATAADG